MKEHYFQYFLELILEKNTNYIKYSKYIWIISNIMNIYEL